MPKYFKRIGTPGHYRYFYTKEDWEKRNEKKQKKENDLKEHGWKESNVTEYVWDSFVENVFQGGTDRYKILFDKNDVPDFKKEHTKTHYVYKIESKYGPITIKVPKDKRKYNQFKITLEEKKPIEDKNKDKVKGIMDVVKYSLNFALRENRKFKNA